MNNPQKKELSPVMVIGISIITFLGFLGVINSMINTPLSNSFEDAAEQSRIDACESQKALDERSGIKNAKDCRDEN